MNPATRALCNNWDWSGSYLRLVVDGVGNIDFSNAPTYTADPTYILPFSGEAVAAERSAEIAAKTLLYRGSTCTAHDAFDLAAIYLYERSALHEIAHCRAITDRVVALAQNRIELARHQFQSQTRTLINPTVRGKQLVNNSCEIALEALAELRRLIPEDRIELENGIT